MNRDEALQKVVKLMAAGRRGPEGSAFHAKAKDLRLKYGISEQDIAGELDDPEEPILFGVRWGWRGRAIMPLIDNIRSNVATILRRAGDQREEIAVDTLTDVVTALRGITDSIVQTRNVLLQAAYRRVMDEYGAQYNDEGYNVYEEPHFHDMAITRIRGDLRKDYVERAVGVTAKDLWRKKMEAQHAAQQEEA